jgi:hypothetical protein
MEESNKIILRFKGVEVELNAYDVDIHNQVDIRRGESYNGELIISFSKGKGDGFFTTGVIYSDFACEGSLEIENQFSGRNVFIENATLIPRVMVTDNGYSTELEFNFNYHRKNSL